MTSRDDKNRSRKFWDEQAQRFEDHYPLIAQLLRDRGHSAWLAEECDRLTAELAAMKDECERLEQRAEDAVDTLNDEREEALLAPSSTTASFYCAGDGCETQCPGCEWSDEAKPESTPSATMRTEIPLDVEASKLLRDTIGFGAGDEDEASEITLKVSDGASGHGLYVWLTEYPEEGAIFLKRLSPNDISREQQEKKNG